MESGTASLPAHLPPIPWLPPVIAILPKITGLISGIGSAFIIRDIYNKWRNDADSLTMKSRVMINVSISDIGSSFIFHFLGTWMVPSYIPSEYVAFNTGNDATCATQQLIGNTFWFASIWSSAFLALTYWLNVVQGWSEFRLKEFKYKLLFLGFPWIYGLAVSISDYFVLGVAFNGLWMCDENWQASEEVIKRAKIQSTVTYAVILCVILCSMGALTRFVYWTEQRMDQYLSEGQRVSRDNTKQVAWQGIFYALSFFAIAFFIVLGRILYTRAPVWYWILFAIVFPLQGLLNAMVYFRPWYIADRERCRRRQQRGLEQQLNNQSEEFSRSASVCRVLDITPPRMSSIRSSPTRLVNSWRGSPNKQIEQQCQNIDGLKESIDRESTELAGQHDTWNPANQADAEVPRADKNVEESLE